MSITTINNYSDSNAIAKNNFFLKLGQTARSMSLGKKIVAAFQGMHVSPAKHSYASVTDGQTDRQTDRQKDTKSTDKVIPMCRYASQATQKLRHSVQDLITRNAHVKY